MHNSGKKELHNDRNQNRLQNFVPVFWNRDEYFFIRDSRYDAYWNWRSNAYEFEFQNGIIQVGGSPVIFFHFSGTSLVETLNEHGISGYEKTVSNDKTIEGIASYYLKLLGFYNEIHQIHFLYNLQGLGRRVFFRPCRLLLFL